MEEFDADSARELGACLRHAADRETERFIAATSLDARRYRERFGAPGNDSPLAPLLKPARVG